MSEFDWSERFPDMRPVRSAPVLARINGIGCGVYGSRGPDPETGTYVTTYCFSFLFLPVIALTAYRVANAPSGGWYFVGRVPLSTFARTWNVLVLLTVLGTAGLIGWTSYTSLASRLERGTLDLSAEETILRELYAGKRDEKYRRDFQAQLDQHLKTLEATSKGRRGVTYAVAAKELARLKMSLAQYGDAVDRDEVVNLAESAYQAAPSFATRRLREDTLLFRASGNLARKDPAYATLVAQTRRTLSPSDRIALVLEHGGKRRSLALADADVRRALELVHEARRKAPDVSNAWAWAMLRANQLEAEKLAKVIREDPIDNLVRTLNVTLYPFSAEKALRSSWALLAAGKEKEAAAVVKQCADRGVPMPRLP